MKRTLSLLIALLLVLTLAPAASLAEGDVTTVIWYTPDFFNTDEARLAEVMDYCNEILAQKGLKLDMRLMDSGEYGEKIKLMSAGAEECDIMWTGYLSPEAKTAWEQGMVQLLEPYTSEVPALMDLIKIYQNGTNTDPQQGLYAIPCLQIMCSTHCFYVRKDIVDQYDLYDEIAAIKDYNDLDDFFMLVKDYLPEGMYMISRNMGREFIYDDETGEYTYLPSIQNYTIDLNTMQVMDDETRFQYELESNLIKKRWQENGFFHPDMMTITDPLSDLWATNQAFSSADIHKPGGDVEWYNRYGVECVPVTYMPDVLGTGAGTTLCVAHQSDKPLESLKLIEEVFTNKDLYNTLIYGFEGKDYDWVDESHIKQREGCYQANGWAVGNQFLAYPIVGQAADVWEQTRIINENAYRSPIMEFAFDKTNVEAELANLSAIRSEYGSILGYGLASDPEAFMKERNEKLKAAGEDKVIAEINAQLAAFVESQK